MNGQQWQVQSMSGKAFTVMITSQTQLNPADIAVGDKVLIFGDRDDDSIIDAVGVQKVMDFPKSLPMNIRQVPGPEKGAVIFYSSEM